MPAGPSASLASVSQQLQELPNNIVAALRQGLAADPNVPNPVGKVVAQNVPTVADIAAARKAKDPTKEAVREALLGDDRVNALAKALKACDGDYSQFTKYQSEISLETVVEDAQMFGGFDGIHKISVGL